MRRLPLTALFATTAVLAVPSASPAATRTINFDDFTAPTAFLNTEPVTERYASLGLHLDGPAAGSGGAVLDVGSFVGVTGESEPNALAFNTTADYTGGGTAEGPETITFDTPIHSASIRAGQNGGGTVRMTAFDGATAVSTNFQTAQAALQTLEVAASRITSLRLEFTGSTTVWDDLTWGTAPVSGNDAFTTPANTALNVGAPGVLGNDADADADPLTATLRRAPNNGLVDLRSDGSFIYTPKGGFSGVDSFDYSANDGTGNGNVATVTIAVQAPPPSLSLIPSTVSTDWLVFRTFTRNKMLTVNDVPAGARVRVQCKTKRKKQQKKACPKTRTINSAKARDALNVRKPFRKRKLPVGTRITITITVPGAIGKRFTYVTRKRKVPKRTRLCIPPGGKAGKCS